MVGDVVDSAVARGPGTVKTSGIGANGPVEVVAEEAPADSVAACVTIASAALREFPGEAHSSHGYIGSCSLRFAHGADSPVNRGTPNTC